MSAVELLSTSSLAAVRKLRFIKTDSVAAGGIWAGGQAGVHVLNPGLLAESLWTGRQINR